jgi:quercetin dioxygenase-like cupin family protein
MKNEAFVRHIDDYNWETRPGRIDGVRWKLLVDADRTPSHGFSLGVLYFPPGTKLALHRHAPQEVYWIRDGKGQLRLDDTQREVETGDIIYIPENLKHGIENTGDDPLVLMWLFPTDTWAEVAYMFK